MAPYPTIARVRAHMTARVSDAIAVAGISADSAARVTFNAPHGLSDNTIVRFAGVLGMTQINGLQGVVTVDDATHVYVDINTTAFSAYTSGGNVSAYDALIQRAIDGAGALFGGYLDRELTFGTATEYRHGNGKNELTLYERTPVATVASVVVEGVGAIPAASGPWTSGWWLHGDTLVLRDYTFQRGRRNVCVTYTGGFTTLPEDICHASTLVVASWLERRSRAGISSKSLANETIVFDNSALDETARAIVLRYARVGLL